MHVYNFCIEYFLFFRQGGEVFIWVVIIQVAIAGVANVLGWNYPGGNCPRWQLYEWQFS